MTKPGDIILYLKKPFEFFLYSNLFISLCASALTFETCFIFRVGAGWHYLIFVFLSTFVLYNIQRLFYTKKSISTEKSERHKWIFESRKLLSILSVIALAGAIAMLFFFPVKFVFRFIPAGLASLAYFIPQTNLRAIPLVKAGIVAFVWTCVTYFFPILLKSDFSEFPVWQGGASRFFFLLSLAIAFNIRDIETDKNAGLKTLPLLFGVKGAKIICGFFMMIFCALVFFTPSLFAGERNGLILSAIVTCTIICFASETRGEYFYSLILDGMMPLQAGMVAMM